MSEKASRIIIAIEALVICLPLTALFLIGGLPSLVYFLVHLPKLETFSEMASGLFILATLVCAWRLMAAFAFRGSGALRSLSVYWWILPFVSGVLGVGITVYLWSALVIEPSWINEFGWGVPFLVPLLHLCFERWARTSANPSFNRTSRKRAAG